jgi:hypothetical protein
MSEHERNVVAPAAPATTVTTDPSAAPAPVFGHVLLQRRIQRRALQRRAAPTAEANAAMQQTLEVSQPGDAAEAEADRMADALVEGRPTGAPAARRS